MLGLVLLVVAAAIYVSTPRGFQRVWLPLASALLDADVSAAYGRVDLRGHLEVRELIVRSDALEADVAHGRLEVDLLALPPWRRPLVEELTVESARVLLHAASEAQAEPVEEVVEPEGAGLPPLLRPLPVRVSRAALREVVLESRGPDADELRWRVGVAQAEVRDVSWALDGVVALETDWVAPGAPEALRAGELVLNVDLQEPARPEEGAPREPVAIAVHGELSAGAEADGPRPLQVTAAGRGTLDVDQRALLESLEIEVSEGGAPLATLRAHGTVAPFDTQADLEVELDARPAGPVLARIPLPEGLAALLAPSQATLRGRLHQEPEALDFDGSVRFEGLAERPGLPPSLDLAAQVGLREERVELGAFSVRELDASGQEGGLVRGSGRIELGEPSTTRLELTSQSLRAAPWLALFDVTLPPSYGPLPLDAEVALELEAEESSLEGEGRLRILAATHPRIDEDAAFDLEKVLVRWNGDLHVEVEGSGPPSTPDGTGRLELALDRLAGEAADAEQGATEEAQGEQAYASAQGGTAAAGAAPPTPGAPRPRMQVELRLAGLDATALMTGSEEEEAAAEEEPSPEEEPTPGPGVVALPFDLDAKVDLEASRLGLIGVDRLGVDVRLTDTVMAVRAQGEGVARGTLDLDFERTVEGPEAHARWRLAVDDLHLKPLVRTFAPAQRVLTGRLDVESEGEGRAPVAEAGWLASADGDLRFRLRGARAEGLRFQEVAAAQAGMGQLLKIRIDEAQGDFPIEKGTLHLKGVQVDGDVVHFLVDGTLNPERVDLIVNPRLGPDLAAGSGLQNLLFAPVSSLVALPFVVTVKGPLTDTSVGVRPATPALLGDVVDLATGALQGAASGAAAGARALSEGEGGEMPEGERTPPVAAPRPGEASPEVEPTPDTEPSSPPTPAEGEAAGSGPAAGAGPTGGAAQEAAPPTEGRAAPSP